MKGFDDAILGGAIQVNQEVPARHEIEVREGRIPYQIVVGEQDELAQLASDPVAGGLAVEETREPRFRDVTHLVVTVESIARGRDRVLVKISGKDLHERVVEPRGGMFRKEHGDRIRLLARGAARDPYPYLILGRLRLEQLRNKLLLELFEGLGVPEEMCHADEELFHQRERLLWLLPHQQRVIRQGRHPDDGHPPMNPAKQRRRLVGREVVAGPDLEQHQDVAQGARVVEVIGRRRPIHFRQPGLIRADPRRHLLHWQHDINKAGGDGVARHIAVFGLARILRDREAAMFLDALEPS